jgi:MFS family permease
MKKSLWPLFLGLSFRSVAISLLSFFSCIFIFKAILRVTANEKYALLSTFCFFLSFYLFKLVAASLAENLSQRIGLKKQLFLGYFLNVLVIGTFIVSINNLFFLIPTSIIWGLSVGLFWFGWHGLLAKDGYQERYGQALGTVGVIETILLLGAPLLGGLLISQFGYQALYLASLGFIILGLVSISPLPDEITHRDATLKEILKLYLTHKRMFLTYFSGGATSALNSTVFVLYTFIILKRELVWGGFFSLSMLLVALTNFLTGKWVDQRGKRDLVAYGAGLSFLSWLGKFLLGRPITLLIFDVIYRIASGMLGIPLDVLSYQKVHNGHSTGRAILFREVAIAAGSIFACCLLVIFSLIGLELRFSFLIGIFLSFSPLLIIKGKEIYGENRRYLEFEGQN